MSLIKKEDAAEKEASDREFPNELKRMITELSKISDPVKKHFQYQLIVDQTYQRRKDPEMRNACEDIGLKHISKFDAIAPHLKKEFDNKLPQVLTFKHLPTILSEDGDHDQAIEICKKAISYKLKDGTKGGFQARIKRIEKKRAAALKKKSGKKPTQD